MNKINIFNYINSIIYSKNLIEASAGTGKTNIISLLYLRFLLNINLDKYFNNLLIDNILIVTFTELASLEIKNRLLNNIRNLKISCIKNYCIDSNIYDIFNYIKNFPNIINFLTKLEYQIDIFSIFTIHSFCKKIIFNNFLYFNINYNSEILSNEINLIYELVILYWNNNLSNLSINIIKIIKNYWLSYNNLFNDIKIFFNFIKINLNFNYNKYKNINHCYYNIIYFIKYFKKEWLINRDFLFNYLLDLKIKYFNFLKLKYLFKEIYIWCCSDTIDFYLPKSLYKLSFSYLINKYKNIFIDKNILFINIDFLKSKIKDLYNYILLDCLNFIRKNIEKKKKYNSLLSFNDLILILYKFINNDNNIDFLNNLRKSYPIIFIDEFQDTDYFQFNIFKKIYINNFSKYKTKIILIGDPKQLIYSFRGANIFNYIYIKKLIKNFYTLNINWRSSYFLNKCINKLFINLNNPFIFKDILFNKINSLDVNKNFYILNNNNNRDNSIKFFFFENLNYSDFKYELANFCAIKIIEYLNNSKYLILDKNLIQRRIIPSDISILVYSNSDIKIILDVFSKYNLPILSYCDDNSIFNTIESKEIYYILNAILFPYNKTYLKNALLTSLFNFDIFTINKYFNNYKLLNNIINDFYFYYNLWNKNGIYLMIKFILEKNIIKLNYIKNKNKLLINFINLSEILQIKYLKLNNKYLLIKWLFEKINNLSILNNSKYNIKYDLNINSINVTTIHKSKGLQYNIVWLPFLFSLNKKNNYYYYYNRKNFYFNIDFYKFRYNKKLMLEEFFSEEIRLFYVALTRSIYQCNIFIYNFNYKNMYFNNFYINKIFNLYSNLNNFKCIKEYLFNFLFKKNIYIKFINFNNYKKKEIFFDFCFDILKKDYKKIKFVNFINKINILSFSKIIKDANIFNKDKNIIIEKNKYLLRGKNIGNFFHNILEIIDFKKLLNINFILYKLNEFDINKKWFFKIKNILFNLLNVNLKIINVSLNNKSVNIFEKEFDFFLCLSKKIDILYFNDLLKKYNLTYNNSFIDIKFDLYGYLNGVIDLIFIKDNKYYIVDYKTNYIGNSFYDYNNKNMSNFIFKNGYYIQYLFYTIAINKFLKIKLNNYNYINNFGGIYYIFLRGLLLNSNNNSITGIYFIKPNVNLINILDNFFNKKKIFYER